jgi:transposase-like protein
MTKPYSMAFKQKMVQRLVGSDAVSALQLSEQTGIRQQNLSRWLEQARSLPHIMTDKPLRPREWSVEQKARILAAACQLTGPHLAEHLEREGVKLAEFEQWRFALQDGTRASSATAKRIRTLERELARKEKALAEAATLLVLKKTVESLYRGADDDTRVESDK